jgi:hypothetical protein
MNKKNPKIFMNILYFILNTIKTNLIFILNTMKINLTYEHIIIFININKYILIFIFVI